MFEKRNCDAVVVGAGPVGLFTALSLADRGVDVLVFDEQWRTTSRSYGLALHPLSLRLLEAVGVREELESLGNPVQSLGIYGGGEKRAGAALEGFEGRAPYLLVVPQQALEEVLRRELAKKGVTVHWNHRVADVRMGSDSVDVEVERLSKESTGYSVTRTEWVIDKSYRVSAKFVVGADGHRSAVRNSLSIPFAEEAAPMLFNVFEFTTGSASGHELQIVLDDDSTSVLWPMKDGRFRWSFEVAGGQGKEDPRFKSRLAVQMRDDIRAELTLERLAELIRARAPWFEPKVEEVSWSAVVRFESRLASRFGKGRVWLAGDSAHLALPMGILSMNAGLAEAKDLAQRIAAVLKEGARIESLTGYEATHLAGWQKRLGEGVSPSSVSQDEWLQERLKRLCDCLPATGVDFETMVGKLG